MKLHTNLKKIAGITLVAAVAAAPLVGTISVAQAAPGINLPILQADNFRNDHRNDRRNNRRNDRRGPNWNNRRNVGTFTGPVTRVKANNEFDMRIDGRVYNVYLDGRGLPGLRKNDVVRVTGERVGGNDIRSARATIVRRH